MKTRATQISLLFSSNQLLKQLEMLNYLKTDVHTRMCTHMYFPQLHPCTACVRNIFQ